MAKAAWEGADCRSNRLQYYLLSEFCSADAPGLWSLLPLIKLEFTRWLQFRAAHGTDFV